MQAAPDAANWDSIRQWRKQTRVELIERRVGMDKELRREQGLQAKQRIRDSIDLNAYPVLGIYWPIRGEIDVRDIARQHLEAGGQVALPVVVEKSAPVEFWRWLPGSEMQRGFWNIPVPAVREVLKPDALIIPLVGFDGANYRLGYGGGYYDRTLAAAVPPPFRIGLGFAAMQLPTIYPQRHDIAMHVVATDSFITQSS